jgi:ribose 5-phosphate isomerase B
MSLRIAIACDHAGITLKNHILNHLRSKNIEFNDFGVNSPESVDYPNFAKLVCESITRGDFQRGILVCGSGIGMSIAANKYPGIRCALIHDAYTARMCREHNNANVIALGERVVGFGVALDAVDLFLNTEFDGNGTNHARRVGILDNLLVKT